MWCNYSTLFHLRILEFDVIRSHCKADRSAKGECSVFNHPINTSLLLSASLSARWVARPGRRPPRKKRSTILLGASSRGSVAVRSSQSPQKIQQFLTSMAVAMPSGNQTWRAGKWIIYRWFYYYRYSSKNSIQFGDFQLPCSIARG